MEQLAALGNQIYTITVYIAFVLAALFYYFTTYKDEKKAFRAYWGFLPLYYLNLSIMAFVGFILFQFIHSWLWIGVMVFVWLFVLIGTIKTYKWIKLYRKNNELGTRILQNIRTKYLIDILIYIGIILLGKM